MTDLRVEVRTTFAELRTEIAQMVHRSEFMDFRREMNERFLAMDQKFMWLVGIQVAGLVAVIGALVGSYYR